MISLVKPARNDRATLVQSAHSSYPPQSYDVSFWLAYSANFLTCVATNLLIRYADFVRALGGTEWHLGWIVGVGMVGSLAVRLLLGGAVDRYGPPVVWVGSLIAFAGSCFAHLGIHSHTGFAIYFWRLVFCAAIAGIFGASMTFISRRASAARMAELIGMLGTSGFLGVIVGTQLGDFVVSPSSPWEGDVRAIFYLAGILALVASMFAWLATRGFVPAAAAKRVSNLRMIGVFGHYAVILAGFAMGMGLGLPPIFLPSLAAHLGITRIGLFFAIYSPMAVITRVATRHIFEKLPLPTIIVASMALLIVSQLMLGFVGEEWMLVIPAVGFGISHALLFPAVIAMGATRFPGRCRGLGTSLMLAASDLGVLLGAPFAGFVLEVASFWQLPPYPTMLAVSGSVLAALTAIFWWCNPPPRRARKPQSVEAGETTGAARSHHIRIDKKADAGIFVCTPATTANQFEQSVSKQSADHSVSKLPRDHSVSQLPPPIDFREESAIGLSGMAVSPPSRV